MSMQIEGEHTTADVKVDDIEEECHDQIQEMVDHEAFRNPVAVMPDTHWGAGAVIGFTMPVGERVCPNTIGVDIGCGMYAVNYGKLDGVDLNEEQVLHKMDQRIRKYVPVGFDVHDRANFHMIDDFPWDECQQKLGKFNEHWSGSPIEANYGGEYFQKLCERIGYDQGRAINSVGTLGGGNHFIEVGVSQKTNDLWVIIHSGSRGIGANIAQYWQDRATKLRSTDGVRKYMIAMGLRGYAPYIKFSPNDEDLSDEELLDWVQGGMGEDFVDYEALKDDYKDDDPEKIEEIASELKEVLKYADTSNRNTDLDYLEEEEAHGYIKDMIFAQTYASVNRKQMMDAVHRALLVAEHPPEGKEAIESVHNYIDFTDQTIRKGACRAHDGEKLVIPFNMSYGTLICEGRGREDWNNSAPHGAGRAMSRTEAKNRYTKEDMDEQTGDTYLSVNPVDETPKAYKDPEVIEEAIGPTAEIIDRVKPVLSVKAE